MQSRAIRKERVAAKKEVAASGKTRGTRSKLPSQPRALQRAASKQKLTGNAVCRRNLRAYAYEPLTPPARPSRTDSGAIVARSPTMADEVQVGHCRGLGRDLVRGLADATGEVTDRPGQGHVERLRRSRHTHGTERTGGSATGNTHGPPRSSTLLAVVAGARRNFRHACLCAASSTTGPLPGGERCAGQEKNK